MRILNDGQASKRRIPFSKKESLMPQDMKRACFSAPQPVRLHSALAMTPC